jgi:Protein of unknown function (DUF2867)
VKVVQIVASESAKSVLASPDFSDAFSIEYPIQLTALEIARNATGTAPRWVDALMKLRSQLVAPFGLITEPQKHLQGQQFVGFFPVISVSDQRVVLGLDDKHLDFRLVIDTRPTPAGGTHTTLSTVIKRHNIWGRLYLAIVLPFHKVIVPSMMRNGAVKRR